MYTFGVWEYLRQAVRHDRWPLSLPSEMRVKNGAVLLKRSVCPAYSELDPQLF